MGWFSEEGHASGFCATGYLVSRIQCNWKMCDNMRLQCSPIDTSLYQSTGITSTSPYFSEEQSYNTYCPLGYFLNGLRCAGGYCDNVSLSCMKVQYRKRDLSPVWMSGYSPHSTPRGPTGAFSEEHGGFSPINMLPIIGMRCYGKHCDNKTLMYRTFSSGYDIFLSGSSKPTGLAGSVRKDMHQDFVQRA